MTTQFDASVASAILHHMNDDHRDDSVLIVRAFADPGATAATMTGLDGSGGTWSVTGADGAVKAHTIAWPAGEISERPQVRREVVALYDAACAQLGIEPRPH